MDLKNIFRRKTLTNKREVLPDSGFKKMIKSLYAMIKEEKLTFKEKKVTGKSFKERETPLSSHLKSKIADFIKSNFKEKGWKSDTKSFFLFTAKEVYFILSALLEEHKQTALGNHQFTNEKVISFVKAFYDFYEGELYITNQEIISQIIRENLEESYIQCLLGVMTYAKLCDSMEYILEKNNEMTDIGITTLKVIHAMNRICKHMETAHVGKEELETMKAFVAKAESQITPNMISFLIDTIDMPDLKTIYLMIEQDELVKLFNDMSCIKHIRKCITDILIKMFAFIKEGNRIHTVKKYVEDNKCLECIVFNIKNSYNKEECDVKEIFKEIIDVLIIHTMLFETGGVFKNHVFQLILKIVDDYINNKSDKNNLEIFEDTFTVFFKDLFSLSYVDREDIKAKFSDKNFDRSKLCDISLCSWSNNYKNYEMINYLLSIFEFKETELIDEQNEDQRVSIQDKQNLLRKIIIHLILDIEIPLTKYRLMINNTDFCRSCLENLHECPEEIISYYFSVLLALCENSNGFGFSLSTEMGPYIAYVPTKEITSVIRCLIKCRSEDVLMIILKHFKAFLGLSSGFQKTFVNCGYFSAIVKIFHYTLEKLGEMDVQNPFEGARSMKKKNSSVVEIEISSKRSATNQSMNFNGQTCNYTCQMIIKLLDFLELLLVNNNDNIVNYTNCGFHHSYFTQFYNFPKWTAISYKLWCISMLYETESEDMSIKIFDILKRYYQLRENLGKSNSVNNLQMNLEEMMEINEAISLKFVKDKPVHFLALSDVQCPLKEIILDFPNLLDAYTQNYIRLNEDVEKKPKEAVPQDVDQIENENTLMILEEELKIPNTQPQVPITKYWDIFIQNLVKKYFKIIFDLVHCYNKTLFTHKFKNVKLFQSKVNFRDLTHIINKTEFSSIFHKIILLINQNDGEQYNFLTDLIKLLCDKALRFKMNNEGNCRKKSSRKATDDNDMSLRFSTFGVPPQCEECEELYTENIVKYYKERYKIDDTFLQNRKDSISNYTNFTLQSPLIIRNVLKSLKKAGNLVMIADFLDFVEFLCKMNENNAKLLLGQSLVKDLLAILKYFQSVNIPYEQSDECKVVDKVCDKILDIFEIVTKYFKKCDIQMMFDYILISMCCNDTPFNSRLKQILNSLLSILYKSYKLSHKINKNIILSCANTRQPNVYNMIFAGGIKFSNQSIIPLGMSSKDVKAKPSCVSIFITMKFHQQIDNSSLVLLKLEREGKDKDISILEFSIEKLNLIIKENDQEIQISNELKSMIRYGKSTHFHFLISKDSNSNSNSNSNNGNELQVKVNRRLLCVAKPELKYLDLSGNVSYSMMIGYPGTNTRDVYQDEFSIIPHISISHIMIYCGKVTTEFLDQFKLSQISSSKNGSVRCDTVKLKHLNEKNYKTFAPSIVNNRNELFNLKLNIDASKVVYELIADKLELLTNNALEHRKADQTFMKIQRKYYIDMTDKDYIVYIPSTTLDNGGAISTGTASTNHTFLLSKVNFSDLITLNQFFDSKSLKKTLLTDILSINSTFEFEARCFQIVDYLLILLNEVPSMDASSKVKSITIVNILKILGWYLISNLPDLAEFSDTNYFKSLLIILYKNAEFLTGDVIDFFFNLSFGLEDGNRIVFFNPWYISFITNLILDAHLFLLIPNILKMYVVTSINTFLGQKDLIVSNESDYCTKVLFLSKFYKILLTVESDEAIDEVIMTGIIMILEQLLKYKKGGIEPTEAQLKQAIHYTLEFLKISDNFNEPITEHLNKRNFDQSGLNATTYLVKKLFSKLFSESIKKTRGVLIDFFLKLRGSMRYQGENLKRGSNIMQFTRIDKLIEPIMKAILSDENNDTDKQKLSDPSADDKQLSANNISQTNPFRSAEAKGSTRKAINSNKNLVVVMNKKEKNSPSTSQAPLSVNLGLSKAVPGDNFNFNFSANEYVVVNSSACASGVKVKKKARKVGKSSDSIPLGRMVTFECDIDNKNICLGSKCFFCNYIISLMRTSFDSQKTFIIYKKFVKNFHYHLYLRNEKTIDNYLSQKGIHFSWYMLNREGPSRIKKKLIAKIDYINSDELSKIYYETHKDSILLSDSKGQKQSTFNKFFEFFECKKKLVDILYADQIFQFNFVHYTVDEGDYFVMAVNCLLFKGLTHFNCVLVIGEKKFYILKNLHIDKEDNLVYSKEKFSKAFWTLENYQEEWDNVCCYLNNFSPDKFESMRKNTVNEYPQDDQCNVKGKIIEDKMMIKFSRNRRDFMIYSFSYMEINELHKRKFLHQNNAMEIFFKNGKNFLFAFNYKKRDQVFQKMMECLSINLVDRGSVSQLAVNSSVIQNNHCMYLRKSKLFIKKHKGKVKKIERALVDSKLIVEESQEKWSQGIISNYDYLMILNTIGGRTYNDISQYPVLPWILKDYTSDINLDNDEFYRDLSYPIYAQDDRDKLKHKFEGAETEGKYHSGTHYSTPGFTSYYLLRLKPFSYYAAEIQGGYFDTADRLFFNIKSLWDVSEKYQELIPEVYYLPEIFINYNEFNLGTTQSNIEVRDVILPNWARGDPRLYVKMTKKAMENCKVSEKINEWIDLIFGYKQQGPEAISSFNVLREACYPFDAHVWLMSRQNEIESGDNNNNNTNNNQMSPMIIESDKTNEELEVKLKEVCEMGQNPIQIFTRAHIKKEKHQKAFAFFSLWTYLKMKDKEYKIKLDTTPSQIKGYYEMPEVNLSRGEGGLSSFRIFYDGGDERNPKQADSLNTFFIVGEKKVLLGPNYKNFIDYSSRKYSFYIVKPANKVYFEYFTYRDSPICVIKSTDDGKYVIIGYHDGVICRYKLKRVMNERLIHPDYDKKKEKGLLSRLFTKENGSDNKSNVRIGSVGAFESKALTSSAMVSQQSKEEESNSNNNNNSNSTSSIPATIYPRINFLIDEWKDYCMHSTCNTKMNKNLAKGTSYFTLILKNVLKFIPNPIKMIEIGESYSLLIVVDTMNKIYIIDRTKIELLREIDFPVITKSNSEIKFICICGHTGDFIVATGYTVILFNVNGVILGDLNLNDNVHKRLAKITSIAVKSLMNTESDIHLFTGHEDGNLIVWKLENKLKREIIIGSLPVTSSGVLNSLQNEIPDVDFLDSYRFAYNREYYHEYVKKKFEIKMKFDSIIKIECKDKPLRLIKLTEDLSNLIIINDDMSLFYLGYEEYLEKKKKAKQDKNCSLCGTQVGNSKILCQLCNKKLCAFCKLEKKIPEISLKVMKPICEDCSELIKSTNKMLYDF